MPTVSTIDKFIELSTDLLTTHPTTTTLSITYTNLSKKSKKSPTTTTTTTTTTSTKTNTISKTTKSTHGVNFKLYEPNSGKCIKYNTKKSKELSRLLNFIGPKGVSNENSHVLGLASLMTNVKYEDNNNTTNTIGGGNNSLENTPGLADTDAMEIIKGVDNETKPVSSSTGTTTTGGASSGKKKNKKKKKKN